jgi:phytoene dehydrogenase-like protein
VLERRDILGGACVTEEVWPGHRVSRASCVVSLLHPKVVDELEVGGGGEAVVAAAHDDGVEHARHHT